MQAAPAEEERKMCRSIYIEEKRAVDDNDVGLVMEDDDDSDLDLLEDADEGDMLEDDADEEPAAD